MKPRCSDCRYFDPVAAWCDMSGDPEKPTSAACEEFVEGHFEEDEDDYSDGDTPLLW